MVAFEGENGNQVTQLHTDCMTRGLAVTVIIPASLNIVILLLDLCTERFVHASNMLFNDTDLQNHALWATSSLFRALPTGIRQHKIVNLPP